MIRWPRWLRSRQMHLSFLTRLSFLMRPTNHLLLKLLSFRSLRYSQMHRLIPMRLTHRSLLKLPKSHSLLNYQSCRSLPSCPRRLTLQRLRLLRWILSFPSFPMPLSYQWRQKHLSCPRLRKFQTSLTLLMILKLLNFRLLRCCLMHRLIPMHLTHRSRHLLRSFPSFPMLRWPHWLR